MIDSQEDSSYSPYYRKFPIILGMDAVRRRLKEVLDAKGIDLAEASRFAGRNHAYIQQYLNRGTPKYLPEDVRQRISDLTGLSEDQLGRTGRHIESDEYAEPSEEPDYDGVGSIQPYRARYPGAFPGLDARAGAGQGQIGESRVIKLDRGDGTYVGHRVVDEWMFPAEYLRHELRASPAQVMMLEVVGDSMLPTLQPGDRIVVDFNHKRPVPDGLYVIDEGDGPLVKRLQLVRRSEPPAISIISDNEHHHTYTLPLDSVTIIGRVAARISRL